MTEESVKELQARFKRFGLSIIRMASGLPRDRSADVIARQIIRSGTSPGANYRTACRSRSKAEFVAKMGIVEEELDESLYWIEVLNEAGFLAAEAAALLSKEGNELLSITIASIRTARKSSSR
jgi:four helix bundle protein